MYKVQKKDGSLQDFDRAKIVGGVVSAGGSAEDAERVATEVEAWLATAAVNGVVNSADLRNKGLEVLRTVNPTVAASYEAYKKPTV